MGGRLPSAFKIGKNSKNDTKVDQDEWVTYTHEDNKVQSHKTTEVEKHIAKITKPHKNENKRQPASIKKRNLTLLPGQGEGKDLEIKNKI